jgi:hypothetical protein
MSARIWTAVALAVFGGVAMAGDVPATRPAPAGFEQLKTLVGQWRTTEGEQAAVSYKLVSANSALMETMDCHGQDMVTVYHPDNDNVIMTHYCAAQNQPRMRAEPYKAGDKTLTFDFVDGTNMPDASAGHMHKLAITFVDANHMNEAWTFWKDGKEQMTVVFKYERVGSGPA